MILTDSGGIQEESVGIGKPVLVLRTDTERPEGVEAGVAKLIGTNTNTIVEEVTQLVRNQTAYKLMATPSGVYGDGHAAEYIVRTLRQEMLQK